MDEYYLIRSVVKAIAVLRAFSKERPTMGVSELSRYLGLNRTVTQKLLLTLQREGLLEQDPHSKKYSLSPRVVEFASSFFSASPLTREGRRYVHELVEQTRMSCALGILESEEVLYLISEEADASVKAASRAGERSPLHCTATGKCLLAFLPKPDRERILERLELRRMTATTITSKPTLNQELNQISRQGFATNKEERVVGLYGVAAPVLNHEGRGIAALSAAIPKGLVSETTFDEIARLTVAMGKELSARLKGLADHPEINPR